MGWWEHNRSDPHVSLSSCTWPKKKELIERKWIGFHVFYSFFFIIYWIKVSLGQKWEQKATACKSHILLSENTQFTKKNTFSKLLYKHALSQCVRDPVLNKKEPTDSIQLLGMDILSFLLCTNTYVLVNQHQNTGILSSYHTTNYVWRIVVFLSSTVYHQTKLILKQTEVKCCLVHCLMIPLPDLWLCLLHCCRRHHHCQDLYQQHYGNWKSANEHR